jgi:hypothetical protein
MNKDQFIASYNDIVEHGFDERWVEESLLSLFSEVEKPTLKEWILEIFAEIDDQATWEEITWVAEQIGMKATISFK